MKNNSLRLRKEKIITIFNQFDKSKLKLLNTFYDKNALFEDPIVKIQGLDKISDYYYNTYKAVKSISFDFKELNEADDVFYGQWIMTLTVKGLNQNRPYQVDGLSVLKFNEADLVIYHKDFVDIGSMVYEKIPVLGKVLSLIKKNLGHGYSKK